MKLRNVNPDSINIPETRVTSYFTPEIYQEFRQTIERMGIIEPICCIEVEERLYLVDGLHRLIEAKNSGAKTVPVVVMEGKEEDIFLTNLFLNTLRGKVKVKELRQVVDLLYQEYEIDPDTIAQRTGLTRRFVEDLIIISQLPEEVVAAFDEGRLEKGKALALSRIKDSELLLSVFYQVVDRRLSVKDVEEVVALTLERVKETVEERPPKAAEEIRTLKCDFCGEEYETKWMAARFMCGHCESALRAAFREVPPSSGGSEPPGQE